MIDPIRQALNLLKTHCDTDVSMETTLSTPLTANQPLTYGAHQRCSSLSLFAVKDVLFCGSVASVKRSCIHILIWACCVGTAVLELVLFLRLAVVWGDLAAPAPVAPRCYFVSRRGVRGHLQLSERAVERAAQRWCGVIDHLARVSSSTALTLRT